MATQTTDIRRWLAAAPVGSTHMVVATDTFDYEDFPVYVGVGEDVGAKVAAYSDPNRMLKVMEVYDLRLPIEDQLKEFRAWHL